MVRIMGYINIKNIKTELINFLRNQDIFSTTTRGVTTSTDTGTFDEESNYTLETNPTKVKNVRSITVASTLLNYGSGYTINFETGVITFTSAQTGAYIIVYDQGTTDKIYPDYPRDDLTINSFPRINIDLLSIGSEVLGLGNENVSGILFTIIVYAAKQTDIIIYIDSIRKAFIDSHKSFYYLTKIKPSAVGPLIPSENEKSQIMQQNIDFESPFNFEVN